MGSKNNSMTAAVVHGEGDIRIEQIPVPKPKKGEVLLKVRGSGVCATDVKILGGSGLPKHLPTILGHEVAGTIAELGEGISGINKGDRVAVYPIAACGSCFYCSKKQYNLCLKPYGLGHGADGGFSEYMIIPNQIVNLGGIIPIAEDMDFDMAAMIEPVSCCISAANACRTEAGKTVLIIGCGPLGLLHIIVSKAMGARVIVSDINEKRLDVASEIGADTVLNPEKVKLKEKIKELTGLGADIVIAAIGIPSIVEKSLPLVRNGGIFNIFGGTPKNEFITLDPRWLHYGEITLTGTFAASLDDFKNSYTFVKNNWELVSKVISTRCGLHDLIGIVENIKKGDGLKSIIVFD